MNAIRPLFALFLLVACSGALAQGPKEGTYVYDAAAQMDNPVHLEIILTKDKNGNFIVSGKVVRKPGLNYGGTQRITGMLKKSGKLLANVFLASEPTNLNKATDLDGEWSARDNGIRLQGINKFGLPPNAVAKLKPTDFTGTWDCGGYTTTFVQVGDKVTGHTSYDGSRIYDGVVTGDVLKFKWSFTLSAIKEGTATLEMLAGGKSFRGRQEWPASEGVEAGGSSWNGKKIK